MVLEDQADAGDRGDAFDDLGRVEARAARPGIGRHDIRQITTLAARRAARFPTHLRFRAVAR
jgi:hypothetical protein